MIIGVDFDNTIVNYDGIFHRIALERNLIPLSVPTSKKAVRDFLRSTGNEAAWTELQGYVYGERMSEADAFVGVKDFFARSREKGHTLFIISHKTRYPFAGPRYDLHAAAKSWLDQNSFFSAPISLPEGSAFFELELADKLRRIETCACDVFIDDLPELFREPLFPRATEKILFDPFREHTSNHDDAFGKISNSWNTILSTIDESSI